MKKISFLIFLLLVVLAWSQEDTAENNGTSLFDTSMYNGREFLLQNLSWTKPHFAMDYFVGDLHHPEEAQTGQVQIADLAAEFLNSLVQGQMGEEFLWEEYQDVLLPIFEQELSERSLLDFHLGEASIRSPFPSTIAVVLFGEPGIARGMIYLTSRDGEGWKIEDVQINWKALDELPHQETFDPGAYASQASPF